MPRYIVLLALWPLFSWAQVYKCQNAQGQTSYHEQPCEHVKERRPWQPPALNVVEQEAYQKQALKNYQQQQQKRQQQQARQTAKAERQAAQERKRLLKQQKHCQKLQAQQRRLRDKLDARGGKYHQQQQQNKQAIKLESQLRESQCQEIQQ